MRLRSLVLTGLLCVCLSASAQTSPYEAWADTLTRITGFPVTEGNRISYTKSGEVFFHQLMEDIEGAKESISMEFYWFDTDTVGRMMRDALIRKAREGVKVRFLMDNLVMPIAPEYFYDKIRKAGGEVLYANDFNRLGFFKSFAHVINHRDHRKIAVIDHRIAYTGGINICRPAVFDWDDLAMRLEGPIVTSMEELLSREWVKAGGAPFEIPDPAEACGPFRVQLIPGNATEEIADIYADVVRHAREYIYIQTPYFIPPPQLQEAMLDAAARGVDVRMVLAKSDHAFMDEAARDYYPALIAAGVRVSQWQDKFDHGKTFVADHIILSCGTQNLDMRSFYLNYENSLFIYDKAMADEFTDIFLSIETGAVPLQVSDSEAKGFKKLWRGILHTIAPLL